MAAKLTRLRERVAELEKVIAWANNSLFGSHGFFLSINGGEDNEHHLDEGIENLKQQNRDYWSRIAELEGNIKHKTELGAILSAVHLQNRSHIASLESTLDLYRGAVRIDQTMEGPRYAGANSSALRRAWEHDPAALASSETVGGKSEGEKDAV